ncbi:hypothetical protein BDN67DRAFT_341005 [Paxillus ammoniavirescens]|nr:hypothetical protein BDN67DRAFT_341005 [Paxillus ammoniavirescens]
MCLPLFDIRPKNWSTARVSDLARFCAAVVMSAVYDYEPSPRNDPMVHIVHRFLQASMLAMTAKKVFLKMFPFCKCSQVNAISLHSNTFEQCAHPRLASGLVDQAGSKTRSRLGYQGGRDSIPARKGADGGSFVTCAVLWLSSYVFPPLENQAQHSRWYRTTSLGCRNSMNHIALTTGTLKYASATAILGMFLSTQIKMVDYH